MNFHMQPEHGIPRLRQGGGVLAAAGQVLETGGWRLEHGEPRKVLEDSILPPGTSRAG